MIWERKITFQNFQIVKTDYKTGCLLHYPYFKENYKIKGRDLSNNQALDADQKAAEGIKFTENFYQATPMIPLVKNWKKLFWIFHKELWQC